MNEDELDWDEVIKECDLNGDGVIDFQDFISVCLNRKALIHQDDLKKVF